MISIPQFFIALLRKDEKKNDQCNACFSKIICLLIVIDSTDSEPLAYNLIAAAAMSAPWYPPGALTVVHAPGSDTRGPG